jgi:hypothetical protein
MKNNSIPKDFKKIISDPMSPQEIVLVCNNRLEKCDLVPNFEIDPNNPEYVRQVFEIRSE